MCGLLSESQEDRPADGRHPGDGGKVNECLAAGGLSYKPGRVTVRHMLDVICDDIGETAVRDKVVRPLAGLVAPITAARWSARSSATTAPNTR